MMDKKSIRIDAIAMIYLHENARGKSPEELAELYIDTRRRIKDSFQAHRQELDRIL